MEKFTNIQTFPSSFAINVWTRFGGEETNGGN